MNVVTRGIRNAFRNGIRTFSIVVILGISVGLTLSMLVARSGVEQKIESVKSSVGNTISISPAGARGFEGGGTALTSTQATKVADVAHITNVTSSLSDRLNSDDTNLESAVDAGSLGQRNSSSSGVGFQAPPSGGMGGDSDSSGSGSVTRTFTPPVSITGTNSLASASVYGGSAVKYTSGKAIDPTKDVNEAVVGKNLASKNNLKVGDTFTAYGKKITVVGIYDTGTVFSNNAVIVSLSTLQRLADRSGEITSMTATVDSIDNLSSATKAVESTLGSAADVTNAQDTANSAVEPLENVKTIALYSLIGATVAGAVIILLTMMMIVRERRREIGVMKAIGSSNIKTVFQFISESITLTLMGLIVGVGFAFVAATPITNALVTNSESSSQSSMTPGQGGPGRGFRQFTQIGANNIRTIESSMGIDTLLLGLLAAVIIAMVGSAVPAFFISKVSPSEVMRAE